MTNDFLGLPPGGGRRLRRRLVRHGLLHLFLAIAVTTSGLLITAWWPISDLDSVHRVHSDATNVVSATTIAVAVPALLLPGAVQGDFLHIPYANGLTRSFRAWWIISLIVNGLTTIALATACATVLLKPGSQFSAWDLLPFSLPVASSLFVSVNYRTASYWLRAAAVLPTGSQQPGRIATATDAVRSDRAPS